VCKGRGVRWNGGGGIRIIIVGKGGKWDGDKGVGEGRGEYGGWRGGGVKRGAWVMKKGGTGVRESKCETIGGVYQALRGGGGVRTEKERRQIW